MPEIRVEHPNGYSGVLYGESSMMIFDKEGNQVLHTGFRNIQTREELYESLSKMPQRKQILDKMFDTLWREEEEDDILPL